MTGTGTVHSLRSTPPGPATPGLGLTFRGPAGCQHPVPEVLWVRGSGPPAATRRADSRPNSPEPPMGAPLGPQLFASTLPAQVQMPDLPQHPRPPPAAWGPHPLCLQVAGLLGPASARRCHLPAGAGRPHPQFQGHPGRVSLCPGLPLPHWWVKLRVCPRGRAAGPVWAQPHLCTGSWPSGQQPGGWHDSRRLPSTPRLGVLTGSHCPKGLPAGGPGPGHQLGCTGRGAGCVCGEWLPGRVSLSAGPVLGVGREPQFLAPSDSHGWGAPRARGGGPCPGAYSSPCISLPPFM